MTMLAGLSLAAIALGLCVDWLYGLLSIVPAARLGEHAHEVPADLATGCAVLLVALLCLSLLRSFVLRPRLAMLRGLQAKGHAHP
jgi:hypothetical protein